MCEWPQERSEGDEAVTALVSCLRSHDDKERQIMAIRTLERLGPSAQGAVPALIDVMKDGQIHTEAYVGRQWVPEALGRIAPGTPQAAGAITALSQALDVADVDLRPGCVAGTGSLRPRRQRSCSAAQGNGASEGLSGPD